MSTEAKSTNPAVQAIIKGTAPHLARLAAASGLLPLSQLDLLEVLVALRRGSDPEIAEAAEGTLQSQETNDLLNAARADDTPPAVLAYLAERPNLPRSVHEAAVLNKSTPDTAIVTLATITGDGELLELITVNQQRLLRAPAIIDAILGNARRTPEAERCAKETRQEFFEKERGVRQIADELRARGQSAAAEFIESADLATPAGGMTLDDAWVIAAHIEVSDAEIDDSWLPAEHYEELLAETAEHVAANMQRVILGERLEGSEISPERLSLIKQIMFMTPRDRLKLAMKGDREARGILIRDANRVVASAVVKNPRISDREIENIASMRTIAEEVLRLVAMNRAWTRQYPIIHNLARNPRTPIPTAVGLLPRIRAKDLMNLAQNRNVSDAVRRQAMRICDARQGANG